jgi:hypothetical protein
LTPIFAFASELVNGRVRGFETYQVRQITFGHELQSSDYPITDSLFKSFKDYVAADQGFKTLAPVLDHQRSFIELQMRTNIIMAAFGRVTADRVYVSTQDPQVAKAVDVLPRARNLAVSASRQRSQR